MAKSTKTKGTTKGKDSIKEDSIKSILGTTQESKTIKAHWNDTEKEITESKLSKRLVALRRDAENHVAALQSAAENTEETLEGLMRGSIDPSVTISSIFEMKNKVRIAWKQHENAYNDYVEFFGTTPVLQ